MIDGTIIGFGGPLEMPKVKKEMRKHARIPTIFNPSSHYFPKARIMIREENKKYFMNKLHALSAVLKI